MSNTNDLTQAILKYLNYSGKFKAWRNNNNAVYDTKKQIFRKNPTTKLGVGDIIFIRKKDGLYGECEIKTGKDILSEEQKNHIREIIEAHCMSLVVHSFDEFLLLIKKWE
jgi:hypothetical protein